MSKMPSLSRSEGKGAGGGGGGCGLEVGSDVLHGQDEPHLWGSERARQPGSDAGPDTPFWIDRVVSTEQQLERSRVSFEKCLGVLDARGEIELDARDEVAHRADTRRGTEEELTAHRRAGKRIVLSSVGEANLAGVFELVDRARGEQPRQ